MSNCGGCNDGCFDESVELQVGPAGATGATGATGAAGGDGDAGLNGTSILFQNISVSSPTTIGLGYTPIVFSNAPITVSANTLLNVGDMLRLEVVFQVDTEYTSASVPVATSFVAQILFAGSQVWEGNIGTGLFSDLNNGRVLILDLIVTATNTLSSRVNKSHGIIGHRTNKVASILKGYDSQFATPARDASNAQISPITPTLTNSNAITIEVKNNTGDAAHIASVTSILVTKYKIQ